MIVFMPRPCAGTQDFLREPSWLTILPFNPA
jgi:hypothetical protein